jgi:hypothetical protein
LVWWRSGLAAGSRAAARCFEVGSSEARPATPRGSGTLPLARRHLSFRVRRSERGVLSELTLEGRPDVVGIRADSPSPGASRSFLLLLLLALAVGRLLTVGLTSKLSLLRLGSVVGLFHAPDRYGALSSGTKLALVLDELFLESRRQSLRALRPGARLLEVLGQPTSSRLQRGRICECMPAIQGWFPVGSVLQISAEWSSGMRPGSTAAVAPSPISAARGDTPVLGRTSPGVLRRIRPFP